MKYLNNGYIVEIPTHGNDIPDEFGYVTITLDEYRKYDPESAHVHEGAVTVNVPYKRLMKIKADYYSRITMLKT